MTGGLQPRDQNRTKTTVATVVGKDQPGLGLLHLQSSLIEADGPRQKSFPGWHVQPLRRVRVLANRSSSTSVLVLDRPPRNLRLQPVMLSFKRISRQRHFAPLL